MDSLTQAALGGLCGELLLRKQIGWKGMVWGAFFGTLPDLDLFLPMDDTLDRLRQHRGLSHSLLCMFLLSPMFGYGLSKLHQKVTLRRAITFVLLAWFTHVLIDCFNTYGTQIFEPFNNYRVAFGNMAIVDIFFTLPMVAGLTLCLFLKKEQRPRSICVYIISGWVMLYTLFSASMLWSARIHFKQQLSHAKIDYDAMIVSPTLSNLFLWRMVAKNEQYYYVSYWSFFDAKSRKPVIDTVVRTPAAAAPFRNTKAFQTLDWFSKGWWKVYQQPNQPDTLYFVDMRFGSMKNTHTTPAIKIPPFFWKLTLRPGQEVDYQRNRPNVDAKPALHALKERVLGRAENWQDGVWPWEIQH